MNLLLTFYKDTGKYYTSGEVEIPDTIMPWDSNFLETLLENQKIVNNPRQFHIVVDEIEGKEYPAFYKTLIKREHMAKKLVQGRTHPPFREALKLYDEVVVNKFKWDNLSLKEQELMETHIMKTSYYGAYQHVFDHSTDLDDFMSFYDKVVINYHKLEV